jgi:FAD:protein FMN transferase
MDAPRRTRPMSRRSFLRRAAATGAALALGGGGRALAQSAATPTLPEAGMELEVAFELVRPRTGNYYRPYVAVWMADLDGVPVRTLALWVQQSSNRYSGELRRWFIDEGTRQNLYGGDLVPTVSSATRPAGRYVVVWDGLDDQGRPAPVGDYLLNVESSRQQGYYVLIREPVTLGVQAFEASFPGSRDVGEVAVAYRRRA